MRKFRSWQVSALLAWALTMPLDAFAQPGSGTDSDPADAPQFDGQGRQITKPAAAPKKQKVTLPKPLNHVDPAYPEDAKRDGIEGEVVLKLTIDIDGNVVKSVVFAAAGHGFDEAALEASKALRFSPARRANGNPFKAIIKYRYAFKLEAPEQPPEPEPVVVGVYAGRVLIAGADDAALAGATLKLIAPDGSERAVASAADGSFRFAELPPGAYKVVIEAEGYDPFGVTEQVVAGDELTATYRLSQTVTDSGVIDILVLGDRPPREVTRRTLERREIQRIPGTRGDALRSLENLPGVARPPAIAGVLLVRGSAARDTLTFVDGVSVPLIYHFGGLSSVVPTELLSKIDFYPGNFSARYGRAMGGIVDAGIRSPRSDGYHGLVQLDVIDARLLFEGPIPFLDGWTFAAAGRRSHLDTWLGPVLEEAGAGVTQAPRYYDYQFMIEKKWEEEARFRTSFYGSDDGLELLVNQPQPGEPALSGNVGLSTAFQRLQFAYEHQLSPDDRLEMQFALARDSLGFSLSSLFFDLEVFSVIGRAEYSRRLAKNAQLNVGIDMFGGEASVAARIPSLQPPGTPPNQPFSTRATTTIETQTPFYRPATYLEMELTPLSRWRIVPGIRLDYSRDTKSFDASPRLNSRFDIMQGFPRTTVKGGVGMFHQPPQFQEAVEPLGTVGINSNRSLHYSLGVEQEITQQLEVGVEGFYKQLDNLVIAEASPSGSFVTYTNNATGYAAGMEVLLKYKPDDRFFGWLAYTLSRSTRKNGPNEPEYLVNFDQTHIMTMLGSYRFGGGWEFGARFRVVSGRLQTPNVCDFVSDDCDPDRVNALFHGATGAYTPIRFGANNNERLPLFHQLDVRVDKAFQFEDWKFSAYIDVTNAYNNQNVEGITYDYRFSTRQYITGIPILPSLGLRGEF